MKVAIYTCVAGGYDSIREPLTIEENVDYYMISDDSSLAGSLYTWIDVDAIVPNADLTPKDKNRYCKMHPYLLFPDYDFSIYLDGSIQIVNPVSHNTEKIGKTGLAMHKHRNSDCVYSEGIFLTWLGVVDKEKQKSDIVRYIEAGVPRHFGLFECGMIVTDLCNPLAKVLYEKWYEEYNTGVKRDQQALIYTLWKMGLTTDDIGEIGEGYNILTNPDVNWCRNAHYK